MKEKNPQPDPAPPAYRPEPLDTAAVQLPAGLLELTELLSRNVHENWARRRLAEGWTWGPRHDDTHKQHPCLRPYDDLPESERIIDRTSALETLRAILALGYRIEAPQPALPGGVLPLDREVEALLHLLRGPATLDLMPLLAIWQARQPEKWKHQPDIYEWLGRRLLRLGEPLLACDVLSDGLQAAPQAPKLRQQLALGLARSGASHRANALLRRLHEEGHRDPETLGLLGRTYKDLWEAAADPREKQEYLQKAFECYTQAYQQSGTSLTNLIWNGINAATTALLRGNGAEAVALAADVRALCLRQLEPLAAGDQARYYPLATLGEAALIVRDWGEAERRYAEAAAVLNGRFGYLKSTRRNARMLLAHHGADEARFEPYFRLPRVAVFAGHMIDPPGHPNPRFPSHLEDDVRLALAQRLDRLDVGFGYASACCGGDILFLETVLDRGGKVHVVLPYEAERFSRERVDVVPGRDWGGRFRRVLDRAAEVVVASTQKMADGVSVEYANLVVLGLSRLRAEYLGADLVPVALWDGEDGPGATAEVVRLWRRFGHEPELIDLAKIQRESRATHDIPDRPYQPPEADEPAESGFETHLMAMLFADAVKFSTLTEEQIPRFVEHFLGMIGRLLETAPHRPVIKNTWGDGLYFVFASVRDAGNFALDLSEQVLHTDWTARGLPETLSLRIALHAGPVYACTDPVTGQRNFLGTHVSRAARIEPITPPGHVYASQAFAALAAAERVRDFACEYVGLTPLPKNAGTLATYLVRRCSG